MERAYWVIVVFLNNRVIFCLWLLNRVCFLWGQRVEVHNVQDTVPAFTQNIAAQPTEHRGY